MDTKILTLSKTPEGGVIKLCVRTLLIADSEAMSHFCIHIKYASRCYPPPKKTNVNNQPKVAIIVPVYNVASYLRECLDSILTQTYTNFTVFELTTAPPMNLAQFLMSTQQQTPGLSQYTKRTQDREPPETMRLPELRPLERSIT